MKKTLDDGASPAYFEFVGSRATGPGPIEAVRMHSMKGNQAMLVSRFLYLSSSSGTTIQTSQAVSMEGNNTVDFEVWLVSSSVSTTLNVYVEVSDDMEYWQDWVNPSTPTPIATFSAAPDHVFGQGASPVQVTKRFVRLRYAIAGSSVGAIIRARLKPTTAFFS